jgi:signal transduction histidine kinase
MRFLVRSWEYRRPRLAVGVRIACGIFNVVLGVVLLASAPWTGALALLGLLPLAGAALIFWTVNRLGQRPELAWEHLRVAGSISPRAAQVTGGIAMHAPADNASSSQRVLMRLLVRSWEYRRPRLAVGVRIACGIFNVVLGVVLLASAPWTGALALLGLLPLAGAALIFWTVYRLQQDSVLRVRELEQSRSHVVDDSAARLRRIERDLHDGAQAQMVAVAMKLGLAREKLGAALNGTVQADLERVLELVDAAHRGAKEAIAELRDLARGIHPPVLDRGLGAALAALATRSDPPVELVVDLPERPSAAIETIAYFCAAELLANVAKHSGARHATLEAVYASGLLQVRVSDDGAGGARLEARGGLAGLAGRVRTVDGRLQISSPPGGPTVIAVELPSHA